MFQTGEKRVWKDTRASQKAESTSIRTIYQRTYTSHYSGSIAVYITSKNCSSHRKTQDCSYITSLQTRFATKFITDAEKKLPQGKSENVTDQEAAALVQMRFIALH